MKRESVSFTVVLQFASITWLDFKVFLPKILSSNFYLTKNEQK